MPTHYIIVVHGIGDQKEGETLIEVINRLAEVKRSSFKQRDVITRGRVLDQAHPWVEFDGIPLKKGPVDRDKSFFGLHSNTGENYRFAEVYWADILKQKCEEAASPVGQWAGGMIGRMEARLKDNKDSVAPWVMPMLHTLERTIVLSHTILQWKMPAFDRKIFEDFLADVQVYGEYPACRNAAVGRFHKKMFEIEAAHQDENAEYTIVAHSLGSIMALDALYSARAAYAMMKDIPGLPGDWDTNGKACAWIERVRNFVTLGSPINKFHVLWWFNYEYTNSARWQEIGNSPKIRHFNFCEEQDPVGHHLDVAQRTSAYKATFTTEEDRVYTRAVIPGLAHVAYWKDSRLFNWILTYALDGNERKPLKWMERFHVWRQGQYGRSESEWYSTASHWKILLLTYGALPSLVLLIDHFTFTWAWNSRSVHGLALAAVVFTLACYLGRHLLAMMITWRQLSYRKNRNVPSKFAPVNKWIFRVGLPVVTIFFVFMADIYLSRPLCLTDEEKINAWVFAGTAVVMLLSLTMMFRKQRLNGTRRALDFGPDFGVAAIAAYILCTDVPGLIGLSSIRIPATDDFYWAVFFTIGAVVWSYTLFKFWAVKMSL